MKKPLEKRGFLCQYGLYDFRTDFVGFAVAHFQRARHAHLCAERTADAFFRIKHGAEFARSNRLISAVRAVPAMNA